ncbi:MAG: hypothetical protein NTZ34_11500 [Chloroflexi bacterium]|nr:hypothetical protein [Chloroflexota bacterium]
MQLAVEVKNKVAELYLIDDANKQRKALDVADEGAESGRAI